MKLVQHGWCLDYLEDMSHQTLTLLSRLHIGPINTYSQLQKATQQTPEDKSKHHHHGMAPWPTSELVGKVCKHPNAGCG